MSGKQYWKNQAPVILVNLLGLSALALCLDGSPVLVFDDRLLLAQALFGQAFENGRAARREISYSRNGGDALAGG